MTAELNETPLEDPLAQLERHLITAYIAGAGHDFHDLFARSASDEKARRLLADAARFASSKLSEIEARSLYVHEMHGTTEPERLG